MKKISLLLLAIASCIALLQPFSLKAETIDDTKTILTADSLLTLDETGTIVLECWFEAEHVSIPSGVTSIEEDAFFWCSSLTSIEIPNSVISIEDGAFSGCSSLTSINVSEDNASYQSIDGVLFNKNADTLIYYPKGKKEQRYQIPNSVTGIRYGAFKYCTSLTSIEIPNGVTSIGIGEFLGCTSLTTIEIPNSVTSIRSWAFTDCTSLASIEIPNSVTSIEDGAFVNCTSLASIEIPNSVTSIEFWAFGNCTSLTSIEIPNSVTSIGNRAFPGCTSLTSINVSEENASYQSIDGILFNKNADTILAYPCGKQELSYQIPNGVTCISDGAFLNCSSLTSIDIPNSVINIEKDAFYDCTSLAFIDIPNSVTSIGNWAFSGCTSLTSIKIPNSVTSIGDWTFSSCTSLTSIGIPNSVTSIGDATFLGCTSLTTIEIPNSVTSIGDRAFRDCTSLEQINVAKGNPNYVAKKGVLLDKSCSKLIAYPLGKETKSYVIPKEVRTIEAGAFKGCEHLVSVTLPKNMELDFPFDGCTNLREIHLRNKLPKEDRKVLWWWKYDDCTLYIPKGSEEAYSRYNLEEIFKEVKTE